MQLCVNVQIPLNLGGVQGEAVFIDTHGGFMADRLAQIAEKSMDIISSSAAAATANKSTATLHLLPPHSQTDFIINPLDHIYVIRIHNVMENMAIVNILEEFLDEQPNVKKQTYHTLIYTVFHHNPIVLCCKVKLIVMDSISFHFRTVYNSDTALRQRMLSNLVQTLMRLAHSRNLAVDERKRGCWKEEVCMCICVVVGVLAKR